MDASEFGQNDTAAAPSDGRRRLRGWWSQRSLLTRGVVVVAIPLVPALAALATLLVVNAQQRELDERQAATVAVRTQANSLLRTLLDAETGMRGYLLTGDEAFLEPYREARTNLDEEYRSLRSLLDEEEWAADSVEGLIDQRLTILSQLVESRSGDAPRLEPRFRSSLLRRGKATMDRLRVVLGRIVDQQTQELGREQQEQSGKRRLQLTLAWLGLVLGIAAGIASVWLLMTGVVRRVRVAAENAERLVKRQPLHPMREGGGELAILSTALHQASAQLSEEEERRRAAEEQVRAGEARYRFLAENSRDVILRLDVDGRIVYASPAASTLLGYEPRDMVGRSTFEFVEPQDMPAVVTAMEQALTGPDPDPVAYRAIRADGTHVWLEGSGGMRTQEGEDGAQVLVTLRDITDRKRAEEVILRAKEELDLRVRERTHELEEARLEILQRLALAAEYRDDNTHEHTRRVAETSAVIATRLGLPHDTVELLKLAAPLHDIGKIGISDTILLKAGRFSPGEYEVMKQHTRIGAAILAHSRSEVLAMAEAIALNHHERWDGRGYPNGVSDEDIPIVARIVAVADVFDALTNERPYKPAWRLNEALRQIEDMAGGAFDPQVVDAFLSIARGDTIVLHGDAQGAVRRR